MHLHSFEHTPLRKFKIIFNKLSIQYLIHILIQDDNLR